MSENISQSPLEALQEIKKVMQQSTRIFSLSGMSGIWAGIVALAGSFLFAYLVKPVSGIINIENVSIASIFNLDVFWQERISYVVLPKQKELLIWAALIVFAVAVLGAIFFSVRKNKTRGNQIKYTGIARKLLINLAIPVCAGAVFCLHFLMRDAILYLVPVSLVFYGLALINCSKYTFSEIKYLGLLEVILGLTALMLMQYHLLFWALGFGVLHIVYGVIMWVKYDKR